MRTASGAGGAADVRGPDSGLGAGYRRQRWKSRHEVALIVGAGPGLGFALARRFARAEMNVALAARHSDKLQAMAAECCGIAHSARAYACDATLESDVDTLMRQVAAELGEPHLVVYNAGAFAPGSIVETSVEEFERCWRVAVSAAFSSGAPRRG